MKSLSRRIYKHPAKRVRPDFRELLSSRHSGALGQERFVAPNSVSIAEAYFCEKAWFQAIYADETPVGFLMLYDDPQKLEYHLWRFMIAESHQGKGYARRAMALLIEHVRRRPKAEELVLCYVPGEGSPEGFYRGLGIQLPRKQRPGTSVNRTAHGRQAGKASYAGSSASLVRPEPSSLTTLIKLINFDLLK